MADETEETKEEDAQAVTKGKKTKIVTEKPTQESLSEELYATVDEIKSWKQKRIDNAEPFEVPGTGKYFLIASADTASMYRAIVAELEGMTENRADWFEAVNDTLLKTCVVKPTLDDDAIAALKASDGQMVLAIVTKCRQLSGLEEGTVGAENFS